MTSDRKSKTIELSRLYDLFWQSGSTLDRALVRAKIGMVSAELAKIEITDSQNPLKKRV
jgi:hypothetical protein